jgi:hypothetical protein
LGRQLSRAERDAARKHSTRLLVIDRVFQLIRTVIKTGAACYGIYAGHELIKSLADGKIKWTSVLLAVVNGNVAWALLLAMTLMATWVAVHERRLRKDVIAKYSAYIKELESKIDPQRSSSRLNPDGTTRPEDLDAS